MNFDDKNLIHYKKSKPDSFPTFADVRYFFILLSIYFVALSCTPCSDTISTDPTIESTFTENHETQHTEDACTPLCCCACCSVSCFVHSPTYLTVSNELFQPAEFPVYNFTFSADISSSIWQPPKSC